MKKTKLIFNFIMCTLLVVTLFSVSAAAEGEEQKVYSKAAFGNIFEYTVENGEATIVGVTVENNKVVVPAELGGYPVKKIGREAFALQDAITSLIFQNGIEEIDDYGFSYCDVYDFYFDGKPEMQLKELSLPSSLKKIGNNAFCDVLLYCELELPENLEYIGDGAFSTTNMHNDVIYIPASVEHIGLLAFFEDTDKKFEVDEKNANYSSDEGGILYNKDKTKIISCPYFGFRSDCEKIVIPDTVEIIADYCFNLNYTVKEIVIPDSVTEIGNGAFNDCYSLRKLVIPSSVKKIGNTIINAEYGRALTHEVYYCGTAQDWDAIEKGRWNPLIVGVHFSYGTTTHEYTESITKAPTCKQMGKKTYTCTCGVAYSEDIDRLNDDHSKYYTEKVVTPAKLNKTGKKEIACKVCGVVDSGNIPEIRSIYVREDYYYTGKEIKPNVDISTRADISKNEYEIIYPEKAVDVGTYKLTVKFSGKFEGTHEYTFKILPASVNNLKAQLGVKGITFTWDKNEEATVYKIGVRIDDGKYKYDYEVPADTTTWFVPSVYGSGELEVDKYCVFTVTAITKLSDGTVIEGLQTRQDVKFTPEQKTYKAKEGTYTYFLLGDEATIVKADVKGNVTIPSKLGGKKVTGILSYAFKDLSKLTAIVIPEGVKFIGIGAFKDSGITKITLPATLTDIDENAFQYCKQLKSVVLSSKNPALTLDEKGVLYNKDKTELILFPSKSSVKEYTLPETVTKIWSYAFSYNNTLKSVTVNEGVTEIGEFAFHCCKGMTTLSLPQSLETIGASAFRACTKLTSIVVGEKVKRLPTYTFAYCTRLKDVTLPKGLETISSKVFLKCFAIEKIVIPNVKSIGYWALGTMEGLKRVYFMGTKEEWQAATKKYDVGYINSNILHFSYEDYVHEFKVTATSEPTCTNKGYGLYECPCGVSYYGSIPAKGHSYTTVYPSKATTEKDGISVSKCDICTYSRTDKIPKVEIIFEKSYVAYTGQVALPKVTLKSGDTVLTEGTDYFVTYETPDSTDFGEHKISFKCAENLPYEFDTERTYEILPGETDKIKLTHTTSSIKLSWGEVYGATGYRVYRYDYTEKEWVRIKSTTRTDYTVKGLSSGTRYRFAVQAYHKTADGTVYFSDIKKAVTTSTKPATVKNLYGSSPSKGKLTLSWANVSGESGYEIYYSTSKNGRYEKFADVKANTVKYTATSLKGGKTLYFKVRAYRTINDSTVYGAFSSVRAVWVR